MVAYNGHKWVHGIKFQSAVLRNGFITNLVISMEDEDMTALCSINRVY